MREIGRLVPSAGSGQALSGAEGLEGWKMSLTFQLFILKHTEGILSAHLDEAFEYLGILTEMRQEVPVNWHKKVNAKWGGRGRNLILLQIGD